MIFAGVKIKSCKNWRNFFQKKSVDKRFFVCYDKRKLKLTQTYEVEIKQDMRFQRAGDDGNPAVSSLQMDH